MSYPAPPSLRAQYARAVINEYHRKYSDSHGGIPTQLPHPTHRQNKPLTIGILGAGGAGMYAAMLIQSLNQPDITYELLEANPDRFGGRLWTYNFPQAVGRNDYYDVGAMRYPKIPFMGRTFRLFDYLKINTDTKTLISYVMSLPQNLNLYNEILLTNDQVSSGGPDPFKVGLEQSYSDLINAKIGPMKAAIAKNFQEGWKELLKLDQYSTRAYMGLVDPKYPQNTITTLETFDSASNLYDCALAETVMDSMDFDWPEGVEDSEKWFCVQDGSSVIASRMAQGLQIRLGQRVTAISPKLNGTTWEAVNVTISGQGTRTYDHVITTLPFGCLRTVDTSQCKFDWELQQAMRTLHYDDSVKVAIQFKSRWWEVEKNQMGGVSSTDRPTRIIVYPSYGIGGNTGASMIVSYTWAQDAMRLGSYRQGRQSVPEKQLIELILKDLSDMHGYPDSSHLQSLIVDWHVWNWYDDPFSGGAFALFGPGQFRDLYPRVTQPFGGILHFAGEATSAHHAWLVGALNSAFRSVCEILQHEGRLDLIRELILKWGLDDEFDMDLLHKQVALGQHQAIRSRREVTK